MAEPTEPKKETVRIAVTSPSAAAGSKPTRETVRITLPSRPPSSAPLPPATAPAPGTARPPVAQPLIPPAPEKRVQPPKFIPPPISARPGGAAAATASVPSPSTAPGPKKETARITVLPDPPPASPSVEMKKTQPLIDMPVAVPQIPANPLNVATEVCAEPSGGLSIAFCWGLVGLSALVLLIQILNYIS